MPWGRLDDSLYDHPKLDRLPVDRRLEAVGLWCRSISWCNRFLTDGHIPRGRIEKLDGSLELADLLVAAGLFEATADGYLVHDFLEFNDSRADVMVRRDKETTRQREWRKKKAEDKAAGGHGVTDSVTPSVDGPAVTPDVTASVTPLVTASSRARDVARIPARPGPARPIPENLNEGARATTKKPGRPDVEALHDHGWKRVTAAQRAVLDEIAGRHDSGHEFAATTIRNTPAGKDPLESVMAADRMWKDSQLRRADAETAAWSETKAADRAAAPAAMARVGDVLNGRRATDPEETVPWMPAPAEIKP